MYTEIWRLKMNRFMRKQMMSLMPALVGRTVDTRDPGVMPAVDTESQLSFIEEFFAAGAPEFKLLYYACIFCFKSLVLLLERKTFSALSDARQQRLLDKLIEGGNPLLRGLVILLGLPIHISYYRREDVRTPLGFDIRALKEEAELRAVSRDRQLQPR